MGFLTTHEGLSESQAEKLVRSKCTANIQSSNGLRGEQSACLPIALNIHVGKEVYKSLNEFVTIQKFLIPTVFIICLITYFF